MTSPEAPVPHEHSEERRPITLAEVVKVPEIANKLLGNLDRFDKALQEARAEVQQSAPPLSWEEQSEWEKKIDELQEKSAAARRGEITVVIDELVRYVTMWETMASDTETFDEYARTERLAYLDALLGEQDSRGNLRWSAEQRSAISNLQRAIAEYNQSEKECERYIVSFDRSFDFIHLPPQELRETWHREFVAKEAIIAGKLFQVPSHLALDPDGGLSFIATLRQQAEDGSRVLGQWLTSMQKQYYTDLDPARLENSGVDTTDAELQKASMPMARHEIEEMPKHYKMGDLFRVTGEDPYNLRDKMLPSFFVELAAKANASGVYLETGENYTIGIKREPYEQSYDDVVVVGADKNWDLVRAISGAVSGDSPERFQAERKIERLHHEMNKLHAMFSSLLSLRYSPRVVQEKFSGFRTRAEEMQKEVQDVLDNPTLKASERDEVEQHLRFLRWYLSHDAPPRSGFRTWLYDQKWKD